MRSYGQFCPIARSAEILCERWTLLVVREMLGGSERFNDIRRGVPLMSPSLLSRRLRQLTDAGVIEREADRYRLTEAGRDLAPIIDRFAAWGARHIRDEIKSEELDAGLLMWAIRGSLDREALPDGRVVVEVGLSDAPKALRHWWLVVDGQADLCLEDPGHEPDLWLHTDVRTLTEVFTHERPLQGALDERTIRVHGRAELVRTLPAWLRPSPWRLRE